jgi:hypothetical protein
MGVCGVSEFVPLQNPIYAIGSRDVGTGGPEGQRVSELASQRGAVAPENGGQLFGASDIMDAFLGFGNEASPQAGFTLVPQKAKRDLQRKRRSLVGEHPTPEHIMQIGLGFWASKILLSAVEMGVFTELAHRPEGLEDVQGRLGLHARSARDFLDALVALGLLKRQGGTYSNTPETDLFLDK